MSFIVEAGKPVQISASKLIRTGRGILLGVFCSSVTSSAKIAFSDGTASAASAAAGRFVSPFTPSAGLNYIRATFDSGLYATLTGSAQQTTVLVVPT